MKNLEDPLKNKNFDILFLCHKKDINILKKSIDYAKKNILGYRKIFVLSENNYFPNDPNIHFISEKNFPFNKKTISKYSPKDRGGWYYQQFLKLYFLNVIDRKVLDNLLIIDADVMFLRPTKFFENSTPLYSFETGHHEPYYQILEELFCFGKYLPTLSGTVHHMIYQRPYIQKLFKLVDGELWKRVMENIDLKTEAGFSEQETYFNFMLNKYPSKIKLRKLKYINFPYFNLKWILIFKFLGFDYLASHHYLRRKKFPIIESLTLEFLRFLRIKRILKESLIKFNIWEKR